MKKHTKTPLIACRATITLSLICMGILPSCQVSPAPSAAYGSVDLARKSSPADQTWRKTARQSVEVFQVAKSLEKAEAEVYALGGKVLKSSLSGEVGNPYAVLDASVPPDQFMPALDAFAMLGVETYRTIDKDDVGQTLVDQKKELGRLQARLSYLKAQRSRTKNADDVLKIEQEIEVIEKALSEASAAHHTTRRQVLMSEIRLELNQRRISPGGMFFKGIGMLFKGLFGGSY
jgi:hypothetical protein